jgi:hypothetical protein
MTDWWEMWVDPRSSTQGALNGLSHRDPLFSRVKPFPLVLWSVIVPELHHMSKLRLALSNMIGDRL